MITLSPRQLHILGGASGVGKTRLTLTLIKKMQEGQETPFRFVGTRIAWAVMDRFREQTDELIKQLNVKHIQVYGLVGDESLPDGRIARAKIVKNPERLLGHVMSQFKDPFEVFIVDPMAFFMTAGYDYVNTALSLWDLSDLAASLNITALGMHHAAKARTESGFKRAQDRILGSGGALLGYSDTQLFISSAEEIDRPYSQLVIRPHDGQPEDYQFVWNDRGLPVKYEPMNQVVEQPPEVFAKKYTKKELVAIFQKVGVSQRTAYRYADRYIGEEEDSGKGQVVEFPRDNT